MNKNLQPASRAAIESFIRHILGCQCPDEVFRAITVSTNSEPFHEWPSSYLLAIGGKLLVLIIESDDRVALAGGLAGLFRRGRELRDAQGFNRFRLVVAASDIGLMKEDLLRHFETLEGSDSRLHLHVIAPDQLPHLEV